MLIIGFGTLLYENSLRDTIGENRNSIKYIPVVINDYKRLFNVYAVHYEASHMIANGDVELGAANIKSAPGYKLNGLAFETTDNELKLLDRRERYYKRIIVDAYNFFTKEQLTNTYAYFANDDASCVRHSILELLPNWRDIYYARIGAYSVSRKFGELYDESTYLADGRTLVSEYYRQRVSVFNEML